MKRLLFIIILLPVVQLLPLNGSAQSITDEVKSLHSVLESLYTEMIPLCSQLIGIGSGIAGFAALWYIAARVWRHLANAEPIDFYPLFRPFVIGMCIVLFPQVLGLINGVMQPTVSGTHAMVENSDQAIAALLLAKEKAIKSTDKWQMFVGEQGDGDYGKWYSYTHEGEDVSDEGFFEGIGNSVRFAMSKAMYNIRNSIKEVISQVLQLLFAAASLCINTIRTFNLVVLAILGPLVFGLAVFDGFQNTLHNWLARYLNIFLWLPVANIFGAIIGKIQENMLKVDIAQIADNGDTFFSTKDMAYMVFLIIGIIGYFTVPSVANSIVQVTGIGSITSRVTSLATSSVQSVGGRMGQGVSNTIAAGKYYNEGYSGKNEGAGATSVVGSAVGSTGAKTGSYMKDKLSGNS